MSKSLSSYEETLVRNANVRLCRLRLWSNCNIFGFHLNKSLQPPHVIKMVDSNSPAAAGGLKIRDVLLAVNQEDVSNADFKYVEDIIKTICSKNSSIELLVVEQHFYLELKKNNINIHESMACIIDIPAIIPDDYLDFPKHQPRTCDICTEKFDVEFGFQTVHSANDLGLYIQEVFSNTPASRTSLRKSDRIIEINGKCVDECPSECIEAELEQAKSKGIVKLYVVDTETYKYYKSRKWPLTSQSQHTCKHSVVKDLL